MGGAARTRIPGSSKTNLIPAHSSLLARIESNATLSLEGDTREPGDCERSFMANVARLKSGQRTLANPIGDYDVKYGVMWKSTVVGTEGEKSSAKSSRGSRTSVYDHTNCASQISRDQHLKSPQ